MNDRLKLINKTEFSTSKWVTIDTIKAELCKIANIMEKTHISQLEWTRSRVKKRTQIRSNKTS